MAKRERRSKKNQTGTSQRETGIGDNQMNDEQRYSLIGQYRPRYEKCLLAKKIADKDLKDLGKLVKADLGDDGMDQIKALIEGHTPEGEAAIKARIERDIQVLRWLGVPIGSQGDLFPDNDPTPIIERAFNEGKRQGLAGETHSNPHHHTTEAYRAHHDGYAAGQQTLAQGFKPLDNDNTPRGSIPHDEWHRRMREQNEAVEQAIKNNAVDSLIVN